MDGSMEAVDNRVAGSMVGLTVVWKVESMVGLADGSRDGSIDWSMAGSVDGSIAGWMDGANESMKSADGWMAGSMVGGSMAVVDNWMAGSMVGLTAVWKVESMVGLADGLISGVGCILSIAR